MIEPAAGLTVLIGPNNCGKSAIVAALQILCSNENSTYVMRHGAKECSVEVETDDGHAVEWRRKNSPSYMIDGADIRSASRQRTAGRTARRPADAEGRCGRHTDFDVHFGTQKSPIFLLGGSSANAARFFASSSDAIRLVEMQKRHKEKLAHAQREKAAWRPKRSRSMPRWGSSNRSSTSKNGSGMLRKTYDVLRQLARWIEAAAKAETGLRIQLKALEKHASQVGALAHCDSRRQLSRLSRWKN